MKKPSYGGGSYLETPQTELLPRYVRAILMDRNRLGSLRIAGLYQGSITLKIPQPQSDNREVWKLVAFFIVVSVISLIVALEIAGQIRANGELYRKRLVLCERDHPGILISEHVCMKRDALIWNWDTTLQPQK